MHYRRWAITFLALSLASILSGCAELFAIQNVKLNNESQWAAFVASEEFASRFSLKLINTQDGSLINVGAEGTQQGAFDWHPTQPEIAYFNLDDAGVPSIQVANLSSPNTGIEQFGANAFPGSFWVTQMEYSPDGSKLAMTALLLPFGSIINPNQAPTLPNVQGVLYLADMTTGDMSIVSPNGILPTTLTWSPDGSYIAYTAWADDNQDNLIDFTYDPAVGINVGRDHFRTFIYEVATDNTTPVNHPDFYHLSPTWLDGQRLVLIANSATATTPTPNNSLIVYDVISQQSATLVPADGQNTIMSVVASPDGSKLAYVTIPQGSDLSSVSIPSQLFVAQSNGANPVAIYAADGTTGVLDAATWSNDSTQVYISTANPPSAQLTAFAEFDETLEPQRLIVVDVAAPNTIRAIYQGTMTSSGLMHFNVRP